MMITVYDVNNFGKRASEDYVRHNVPLNDSIVKLASDNGLTRNQVDRVVEAANNETYLTLLKTAEEKYVEFPLASTKDIFSTIEKEASVLNTTISDFDTPPNSKGEDLPVLTESEIFGDLTKAASADQVQEQKINGAEARSLSQRIKGTHTFLKNAAEEAAVEFSQTFDQLNHLIKQALLNGTTFNDVALINEQSMPALHSLLTPQFRESIEKDMPRFDFEKEAQHSNPNPGSSVYQTGVDLEKIVEQYVRIKSAMYHYEDEHDLLQESTDEKLVPLIKEAKKKSVKTEEEIGRAAVNAYKKQVLKKRLKVLPAAALTAAAAGVVYQIGKNKGIQSQNEVLKEQFLDPKLYKRY